MWIQPVVFIHQISREGVLLLLFFFYCLLVHVHIVGRDFVQIPQIFLQASFSQLYSEIWKTCFHKIQAATFTSLPTGHLNPSYHGRCVCTFRVNTQKLNLCPVQFHRVHYQPKTNPKTHFVLFSNLVFLFCSIIFLVQHCIFQFYTCYH